MTGYPWSTGDALKAADLNAAIVAASSSAAAGGPFLPLGGGTVTGPTTFAATTQTGAQALPLPAAKTGTAYTVAAGDCSLVLQPSGTFTLTLPTASSSPGRIIRLKLIAAFAVNSASSNIVQLTGTTSAAIMPATSGKFVMLQSDGAAWQIMMAN